MGRRMTVRVWACVGMRSERDCELLFLRGMCWRRALRRDSCDGRRSGDGIVGSTAMVMWPGHGWCQGVVDRVYAGRTELDRSWSPPRPATFWVEFPVEEMHAMLHLAVERHWTTCGEHEWSWALLAAERPRLDGVTQRCGWPGCPGAVLSRERSAVLDHTGQRPRTSR